MRTPPDLQKESAFDDEGLISAVTVRADCDGKTSMWFTRLLQRYPELAAALVYVNGRRHLKVGAYRKWKASLKTGPTPVGAAVDAKVRIEHTRSAKAKAKAAPSKPEKHQLQG